MYVPLLLSQVSLKNSFGKVVFQILVKIKMKRKKNRLFGRHFEMAHYFFSLFFFYRIIIFFYSAYTYGANFIAEFRLESGFLGVVPWNPALSTKGTESTLVTKSVKTVKRKQENGVLQFTIIRTSFHTRRVTIHFCIGNNGVCRINHTFVQHNASRTKLSLISGFYFFFFLLKNPFQTGCKYNIHGNIKGLKQGEANGVQMKVKMKKKKENGLNT